MKNAIVSLLIASLTMIPTVTLALTNSDRIFSPEEIKKEIQPFLGNYNGMVFERSSNTQYTRDGDFEPSKMSINLKNQVINIQFSINQVCSFNLEDFHSMGLTDGIKAPVTMYAFFYLTDKHCFDGHTSGFTITLFFYPKDRRVIFQLEKLRSSSRYVTIMGDYVMVGE